MAQQDSKCPKCGKRIVEYDDYLDGDDGSDAGTKIHVTKCQICGWRPVHIDKKIEDVFTDVETVENNQQPISVTMMPTPIARKCIGCGCEIKIYAKDRCENCYKKMRKNARSAGNEKCEKQTINEKLQQPADHKVMNIPRGQEDQPEEIYLHFYKRDAELLNKLKRAADLNRRSLGNEILYRLDKIEDVTG